MAPAVQRPFDWLFQQQKQTGLSITSVTSSRDMIHRISLEDSGFRRLFPSFDVRTGEPQLKWVLGLELLSSTDRSRN
jgi:hypothetical protein